MTTRRPRLLMLLHGYFPDDPRASAQARAAVDAGFEVDVIALRRQADAAVGEVGGVRIRRLPVQRRRGGGLVTMAREYGGFTIRAAVAAMRLGRERRYDVVQVHNPPDFLVLAAIGPRLYGARIVFDVHDLASDMFGMRFDGKPGARLANAVLRTIERTAAHASCTVLTVHEPYRRELITRGVRGDKITVVMNTVDERLLPRTRRSAPKGRFVVVYHGTVTPHYGVSLLVEALGLLRDAIPEIRVEIYGEGDAVPELRSLSRTLGVEEALYISDRYLPREEVLRAVQSASVGVVPNLPTRLNRFALSTKLFEYVAMGVPVVSSDLPTIRAHFSEDEMLFFRPGDPSSLASALAAVRTDLHAAEKRVAAARARYEAYRWEKNAEAYVETLRLVGAKAPSGR
jgi:glycosyltransferase involved in cell wall biosynthesis